MDTSTGRGASGPDYRNELPNELSKAAGRWITEDLCLPGVFRKSIEMSEQFFYVEFVFTPKRGCQIEHHRVVVEIPKCLLVKQLAASANGKSGERLMILKLANSAARAAFRNAPGMREAEFPYHEDAIWYEERLPMMNERPCDFSENGINVWLIN